MRQKSLMVKRVSERVGLSGSLASLDWPFSTLLLLLLLLLLFFVYVCLTSRRNNRRPSAFYFWFFMIQFAVMGRTLGYRVVFCTSRCYDNGKCMFTWSTQHNNIYTTTTTSSFPKAASPFPPTPTQPSSFPPSFLLSL